MRRAEAPGSSRSASSDSRFVTCSTAQRIERGWGRWSRTTHLRDHLDTDAITADLTDGVLTVTIPIAEAAKPRRIEISDSKRRQLDAA